MTIKPPKPYPFLLLVMLFFAATPSMGQDQKIGIKWHDLNSKEKQILVPLQNKWNEFTPEKQNRLIRGAKKWNTMSPEQQKSVKNKIPKWKKRLLLKK